MFLTDSLAGQAQLNRRSFLKMGVGTLTVLATPTILKAATTTSPLSKLHERSLSFYNLHTSETLKTVYWAGGEYIAPSLVDINRVLRDHRTGEAHDIDSQLLDLLCDLNLRLDTTEPFHIISGYRSAATNAMLHANSNGVAEHSLHMDGKAVDIRVPGRTLSLLRNTALSMKSGGVGYYPTSDFVHVDVGRIRHW
jgi:uncharacterized protein YcbK (DUF882 family)